MSCGWCYELKATEGKKIYQDIFKMHRDSDHDTPLEYLVFCVRSLFDMIRAVLRGGSAVSISWLIAAVILKILCV